MILELVLFLITTLFVWDYYNKKHRNDLLKKANITGPKSHPLVGSALALKEVTPENYIDFSKQCTKIFGKIYRIWVFNQLSVVISDPKYLEIILSSQQTTKKSYLYDFLESWLGRGLLLSHGKKWHTRRKIITPTFHFKILEQFVEVFDQQSAIMAEKLYEKADGKTAINIFPVVCLSALDIIAETAMGVKVNAQAQPEHEYVQSLAYVARINAQRFVSPSQRTSLLFRLTSPKEYKETKRCVDIMHKFTMDVIEKRRVVLEGTMQNGTQESQNDNAFGTKQRMAFLDVLLQANVNGAALSNEDIREEVDTFMFEGHDTTTSGISFTLYLIARHPEVQARLVDEIIEVIGTDKKKPVSYRELQDLKYLDIVIKEALRMYPSVPNIGRELTEDVVLDDITLPAKTNIALFLLLAMRDPHYFPDPDAFKPERFDPAHEDGASKINPFAYTPFAAGPRNCIGQKFALLEMKSTISKMLRHFELLPLGPDVRPMINLILRSSTGIHVGLKPRDL